MFKPYIICYLFHHFVLKVTSMISDNLTRDTEPGDNFIEYEEGDNLPVIFNCRHGLNPLIKVFDNHNNVIIPPSRSWVAIHEFHPSLGEGTDGNDWVKRGWMRVHFLSEHLARVTLLNHFNTIFKYIWPQITGSQNFLGCRKLE
jgi:hypothetical protein